MGARHFASLLRFIAIGALLSGCFQSSPLTVTDGSTVGGGGGGGGGGSTDPVVVQGVSSSTAPTYSKTWNISCSILPCRFRYSIDQSPTADLSAVAYSPDATNSVSVTISVATRGSGVFYLHAQAMDSGGNESPVKHVYAVLSSVTVEGIADQTTPVYAKVWSVSCSVAPCKYRSVINQSSTAPDMSAVAYTSSASNSLMVTVSSATRASGTWYLHAQAKDSGGRESPIKSVSVVLNSSIATFNVSGSVKFDKVPAIYYSPTCKLDYSLSAVQKLPARRVVVQAIETLGNGSESVFATTTTNDDGNYSFSVPVGKSVKVRVRSVMQASNYTADGIGPEGCRGASWDVRAVDNTQVVSSSTNEPKEYAMTSPEAVAGEASIDFSPNYMDRSAGPFTILDTIVRQLELVCSAKPDQNFPLVYVNWSVNNVPDGNFSLSDKRAGKIGTSHYTQERYTSGGQYLPNLYILGKADVDTDEYDDHVVAHEFGHYLEDVLFRSDSIGGSHGMGEMVDPRLAFGEGFGNAISAMTWNNPYYVDTSGPDQADGFGINVNSAPSRNDRSIYSERSVQHFLWKLFSNRLSANPSSGFDRIYPVLFDSHRVTPALTSVHSFAAYYRKTFGDSDGLKSLWSTTLNSAWNSLCVGACGTDTSAAIDLFDSDDDLGPAYALALRYPDGGSTFSSDFWRLYYPLAPGSSVGSSVARNTTRTGSYYYPDNKMGMNRWYVYSHPVSSTTKVVTISVTSISSGSCSSIDALDMVVYQAGQIVGFNDSTGGCPAVSFTAVPGQDYAVVVVGVGSSGNTSSYSLTVSR